jgi:outer membrane protein OmpA-like peptidoglycan-associated protein
MFAINLHAQNTDNPWALSFGANAVDTKGGSSGGKNTVDVIVSQPFGVSENWNILPSVSYLSLSRSVGKSLSVGVQGSINKMSKYVVFDEANPKKDSFGNVVVNPGDLSYYAVDANVRYSFMSLIGSKIIDPSVRLGAGYTWLGDNAYPTFNPGAGLTFWLSKNVGLALETTYKASQLIGGIRSTAGDLYTPVEPSHFQHTVGITFQFGGKDTDGDGIYDKNDACPDVAGLKQFNGCPDTDGDGLIDGSDSCPTEFGLATLNGCPDTDGDGVADKDDACPDVKGLAAFKGCADTDRDGIADKDDKCPKEVGPKSNGGCPILDSDKDGVVDKEDACPTVAGLISNKGCPESAVPAAVGRIKIEAATVDFETGDADVKRKLNPSGLNAIKDFIKKNPNAKFSIEGHADSDGSEEFNQKLSEERANTVKSALIAAGVKAENLVIVGYGENKPVDTNETEEGKAKNRRTEVICIDAY